MSQLIKCTSCARHVRLTETSCPFCSAVLDLEQRTALARAFAARAPKSRVSRAALFAIGIGVITPLTAACSSDDSSDQSDAGPILLGSAYGGPSPEPLDATAGGDAHESFADASYGAAPPFEDASPAGYPDAAYGGSPPFDAGPDGETDGGDADTD